MQLCVLYVSFLEACISDFLLKYDLIIIKKILFKICSRTQNFVFPRQHEFFSKCFKSKCWVLSSEGEEMADKCTTPSLLKVSL